MINKTMKPAYCPFPDSSPSTCECGLKKVIVTGQIERLVSQAIYAELCHSGFEDFKWKIHVDWLVEVIDCSDTEFLWLTWRDNPGVARWVLMYYVNLWLNWFVKFDDIYEETYDAEQCCTEESSSLISFLYVSVPSKRMDWPPLAWVHAYWMYVRYV